MKKGIWILLFAVLLTAAGCASAEEVQPTTIPQTTAAPTQAATLPGTLPPETTAETEVTESAAPAMELTEEEKEQLLKIGMAELGETECTECIALVMRTVLNRVASGRFGSTIYGVIHAQDQFTPVSDGTFDAAVPNDSCYEALEMVIYGWDESQGALYYEFCEGESWHSKNLELLFQHCDCRFYK